MAALVARAAPSSRSRSRASRPRRAARRRARTARPRGRRPVPRRARRASGARPPASAGGRRPARSAPPRPGRRASARTATGGPAPSASAASSVAAQDVHRLPGHVVQQVERHRRDPGRPRLGDRVGDVAGRCRRPEPPQQRRRRTHCAPSETRFTPAVASAAASPRSSGPGFASIVTSASSASPNRVRTRSRIAAIDVGREQGRRAAAEVDGLERRGRPGPERGVERVRPQLELGQQRLDERPDPGPRTARRRPRVRRRSRSTGRARRRTGRGRTARPAAPRRGTAVARRPPGYRSRDRLAGPRTRQPSGVRRRRSTSSSSVPFACGMAGVARGQEDRDPGDRVAQERRADAAGDPVSQPPARPIASTSTSMYHGRPGRPEPRRQRVHERLDEVREVRLESGGRAGSPNSSPRNTASSTNAVATALRSAPG